MAESRVHNQFKLTTQNYVATDVGEEVTLPCHLSPDTSAVATTIRWFKSTECIYLYKNGQVTERSGYEGRVSLINQELERGNVSLRLRDIRRSDRGVYICQVIHGEQKEEAAVGLRVREDFPFGRYFLLEPGFVAGSRYLQQETQEDKLKREASAGELVGGETSDTDPTLPLKRRRSMELPPPSMGGESSSPDSTVSPK